MHACVQIDSFLGDFSSALSRANTFDAKVQSDASAVSSDYASIVALSVRQAFGATEITASRNSDGSINASDILMFMKGAHPTPLPSRHHLTGHASAQRSRATGYVPRRGVVRGVVGS